MNSKLSGKCANPCDIFMRELAINYPKSQEDDNKVERFARIYRKQQEPFVMREIKNIRMPEFTLRNNASARAATMIQYRQLFHRAKIFALREPQSSFAKVGNEVFSGLLMLAVFWQVGSLTDVMEFFNMTGLIFFMITGAFMGTYFNTIGCF